MNSVLDQFADNPIIDELVFWPPRSLRTVSIRACNVMFRKPFLEVTLANGQIFQSHFPREDFSAHWAEACVILETVSAIKLISDFSFTPYADRDELVQRVLATRDDCIEQSDLMYAEGMYAQFLMQYGEDCKDLPDVVRQKIDHARRELGTGG